MVSLSKAINESSRIVVVGASAAGLACAGALHRNGFTNVSVLEKAMSPADLEHAAPINLGANVVRAFNHLRLKDQLLEQSAQLTSMTIQNEKGQKLVSLAADELLEMCGFPAITTTRRHMLSVLRSAVPEAWLNYGSEVTFVDETAKGLVIQTAGGATYEADLIIGANGFYSPLRAEVLGETKIRKDGKVSVQALIPAASGGDKLSFAQGNECSFTEIVTTRGSIGFGQNNNEDANVFFNVHENEVSGTLDGLSLVEYVKRTYAGIDSRVDEILEVIEPERILVYYPKDRPLAKRFTKGRIALIGDAAHPCFQYTGQGAAMAIESGLVLAQCLKANQSHKDAFRQFEKLRMPRVKTVHTESYKIGNAFGMTNAFACTIRDVFMRFGPTELMAKPILQIHTEEFLP